MFQLYLTPASISYLTQFILSLAITLFLLNRLRSRRTRSLLLLTAFFVLMTAFTGLMILDAALLPFPRVLPAYAENTVLALTLVAILWFAYQFPERYPQRKWEMRILLTLSIIFLLFEAGFMVYRYVSLFRDGNVFNRFPLDAYSLPVVVLFVPVAFLRQTLAADPRPVAWWRKLWKPEGKGARGARNFVLVFAVPVVLGIISVLLNFGLPFELFNAAVSIGILLMLWLFATNYIDFVPGSVNVAARLSILMLTLFLALIGTVGWLIAPSYIATFRPDLRDHQTLRFTPNPAGGYDVSEVDFHFESTLGEKVGAQTMDENGNQRVEFTFPYYGETYTEAYITDSGAISLGEPYRPLNLQAAVARVPTLFPLKISLYSNPAEEDSGLYIHWEPERLIVTWNRLLASRSDRYTFQAILYADGTFEFTNNGLPQPILFSADSTPWLRGVVAGRGEPLHEPPAVMEEAVDLITLSRAGATPLLENYLLAFRRYLHTFMLPVAWVVIGGSLLILLLIPLLLRASITRPLEALTAGVRRMGAGEMDITIPVQSEDEIGFLTGAFNTMSGTLDDHVRNLEVRVADRTRELDDANASLRAEMLQREAVQEKLIQQQHTVAAFQERKRLARDLHDSLNQSIHSLILFSETLVAAIEKKNLGHAKHLVEQVQESARQSLKETRLLLFELQTAGQGRSVNLIRGLEERFAKVESYAGIQSQIIHKGSLRHIPAAWHENLYWITIEALNNAIKHAQASKMTIEIHATPKQVELTVTDNGRGFFPGKVVSGGMGMETMRERALQLGGELTIESEPSKGTCVRFRATIKAKQDEQH
ncbi:MAG: HAMP domain-containing protein [Chloroflexi bacterium]|nr:MAG: HAMP domain-containing protein [Chloroflexota bacterium]